MHTIPSFSCSFLCRGLADLVACAGRGPDPQSPAPATSATVLHATTSLVLVDVVVTDHGKPAHGIDRSRFHVFEDGHEQAIVTFEEHQPRRLHPTQPPHRKGLPRCRRILTPTSPRIPPPAW